MSLFLPTIPQPNDNLDFSQGQLLSNNSGLDTVFNIDHTLFSDSTGNKGFHKKVTLYQVALDPGQAFPGAMVYTKNSGIAPNRLTDLYFSSKPETGADIVRQLTNLPITTGANGGTAGGNLDYIDTPWNLRVYFGQTNAFSGGNRTVVFPTPFTTLLFSTAIGNNAAGTTIVSCLQGTSQLALGTGNLSSVNWSAIGRL